MTKEEWIKIYNAKDGTWDKDCLIDKAYEIITSPIRTNYTVEEIKSEAIKEFAERLKTYAKELNIGDNISWLVLGVGRVDQLVKEMMEA